MGGYVSSVWKSNASSNTDPEKQLREIQVETETPSLIPNSTIPNPHSHIKDINDAISQFGNPTLSMSTMDGFCAHSYKEDCFLMGGGREYCDKRYEWESNNKYIVVYTKNGAVIRIFE